VNDTLLAVNNLSIHFPTESGILKAVDNNSFTLKKGETIGIVGESGSGKSITALSIMQLLPKIADVPYGEIQFDSNHTANDGQPIDLTQLPKGTIEQIRGSQIAMIFQEPMTSLNPVMTCGQQVIEAIQLHQKTTFSVAKKTTLELFEQVKLPDVERIFSAYPHQLSGGQKQRVAIARAFLKDAPILILDEATSALDTDSEAQIQSQLKELAKGRTTLLIAHRYSTIKNADRILVFDSGRIVADGPHEVVYKQSDLYRLLFDRQGA